MADVWCGDILLPNGNTINGIGLATPNVAYLPLLPKTNLCFLSTVEAARIPLYLAAGPSLDVWTSEQETEAWFESILLSNPASSADAPGHDSGHAASSAWWKLARSQSPIGILVQVQNDEKELNKRGITEILFYGTIAASEQKTLPTPPSSSPQVHSATYEQLLELRVHALPLSSHLLYSHSAESYAEGSAQFLPPLHASPQSPKRKRDIFEEAAIANRKVRSKGGQGIAAVAARGIESQQSYAHRKSVSIDSKTSPNTDIRPLSANNALYRPSSRRLSRSTSLSSDLRPLSRKGQPEALNRRSNLSQVATVPLQSEEPTTESRNKDALSKVVMAAMRMHGLQQRKKNSSRRASVAPEIEENQPISENATAEEVTKDTEYKLIYHQTYKGAVLALRKHISEKPLHAQPDRLRDIVEKLLNLFLTDPLAEPLVASIPVDLVATPGSKARLYIPGSAHSHTSPFDLPSIRRPGMNRAVTDSQVYTGSPVSRKKADATEPAHS